MYTIQRLHALQAVLDDVDAAAVADCGDDNVNAIERVVHVGISAGEDEHSGTHNTDRNTQHAHPGNGLLK
jgi:ApbE superfamily uncharacterized protein (UPF0280 family)